MGLSLLWTYQDQTFDLSISVIVRLVTKLEVCSARVGLLVIKKKKMLETLEEGNPTRLQMFSM